MDNNSQGTSGASDTSKNVCGYKSIDDLSQAVLKSVMGAVRSSNDLPISGDDLDFCSSFSSYQQFLGIQGSRLLQLIQTALRYHGIRGSIAAHSELTDVEDRFDVLVDANDQLLERVGTLLDEISGLRKKETSLVVVTKTPKQAAASGGWNKKITPVTGPSAGKYRLLTARNIRRPQAQFKDKIDNSDRPFVPKIVSKPNAIKPLTESLQCIAPDSMDSSFCYPHPYQYELDNYAPDPSWLEKCQPRLPPPIDATPLTLVDTEEALQKLCLLLKTQSEFAVDLEAHSYRSYQGFACLIQISTRDHDYIVDALALREHLHTLNDSFTDPKILKVLHGADQDILWLQRDFGVYLVGLFDTHQASRSMAFQRHRLQELLWHYCSVETNKEYQLEDWRIRPLPEDFLLYARMDTHYLLYIYDCLKNDLLHRSNEQKNILLSVFQRSTQICLKRYVKPQLKIDSYKDLLVTHRKKFNPQQMEALKGLFVWRDGIARQVDESTGFVLPNLMMVQIAELLPREPEGILACCSNIPPLVQEYLMELHHIIKDAREARLVKKEEPKADQLPILLTPSSLGAKLQYCPLDLSHDSDGGVVDTTCHNADGLLAVRSKLFQEDDLPDIQIKACPVLSALLPSAPITKRKKARRRADKIGQSFINPFSKYLPLLAVDNENVHANDASTKDETIWKLLPNTTKRATASNQTRVAEVLKTSAVIMFEPNDTVDKEVPGKDEVTTVRHQLSCERQQHSSSETPSSSSTVVGKKRKLKQNKDEVVGDGSDFVAHDYNKVDYKKMLQADDGNKFSSKKDKKKKHEYDPSSALAEPDIQGVARKKPLMHAPSTKNLTYGKNIESKQQMPKIPWPKR